MAIAHLNRSYQGPFWPGGLPPTVGIPLFTFDSVPPGSVWTGTISVTTSPTLTTGTATPNPAGALSHNDVLVNMIWTLYRNGSPELTWIGLSQAVNVQLFSNDKAVVVGTLPASGVVVALTTADPINLTCTFIGYSGDETEITPVVPFVSGSTESTPYQSTSIPAVLSTARTLNQSGAGSVNFNIGAAPAAANFMRIWGAWLVVGVDNVVAGAVSAVIIDNNGGVVLSNSVVGSGNSAVSLQFNSVIVPVGNLPLKTTVADLVGGSTKILTNAGVVYTFDTLI